MILFYNKCGSYGAVYCPRESHGHIAHLCGKINEDRAALLVFLRSLF
jgi:hypothetical protein